MYGLATLELRSIQFPVGESGGGGRGIVQTSPSFSALRILGAFVLTLFVDLYQLCLQRSAMPHADYRIGRRPGSLAGLLLVLAVLVAGFAAASDCAAADPAFIRGGVIHSGEMTRTFDGTFSAGSISGRGPWFGPAEKFGKADFVPPAGGGPMWVDKGNLVLQPQKVGGAWRSGQVQSVDKAGSGFSQQFGYFVMRASLPAGKTAWPGFWLRPTYYRTTPHEAIAEVDILETWGRRPNELQSNLHFWPNRDYNPENRKHTAQTVKSFHPEMVGAFHDYGVYIGPEWTIFFFDDRETGRVATMPEEKTPMYMIIDYALDNIADDDANPPGKMVVQYARAYR